MTDFNNLTLEEYRALQQFVFNQYVKQNKLVIPPTNYEQKQNLFKIATLTSDEVTNAIKIIDTEAGKLGLRPEVFNKIKIPIKQLPSSIQSYLKSFLPSSVSLTTISLYDILLLLQSTNGLLWYYYNNSPNFSPPIPPTTIPKPPSTPTNTNKQPPKIPAPPPKPPTPPKQQPKPPSPPPKPPPPLVRPQLRNIPSPYPPRPSPKIQNYGPRRLA